jgi:CHAT domain-containing protein
MERFLRWQRAQLQQLESDVMRTQPYPDCPSEDCLREVAAEIAPPHIANKTLQHSAQCDHCGPLLKRYIEIFSDELSPEIEALIQELPGARPEHQREKAREIVRQMRVPKSPWVVLAWLQTLRPRILAGAASLAALAIAVPIWGPSAVEAWQLKKTKTLVAAAYAKDRVTEMRFTDVLHGELQSGEGTMGSNDQLHELRQPELNKAWTKLSELNSVEKVDPRWLQIRGRVLLLKGSKNANTAEESFREAQSRGLNDPSLEIDLAISYFEADVRAVSKDKTPDVTRSTHLLTQILTNPKLTTEQKSVARFNLAVAYEKSQQMDRAEDAWKKYLEIDPNGLWADEARARLKEVQKQSKGSQGYVLFPDPASFLQHFREAVVENNQEEYFSVAASSWLPDMMKHPGGDSSLAYTALADLLKKKDSDSLLSDLFSALRSDDLPAVSALGAALVANNEGKYAVAIKNAGIASDLFAKAHNRAGELWARYAEVYGNQRSHLPACMAGANNLDLELQVTTYHWLQGNLALERAICLNYTGDFEEGKIDPYLGSSQTIALQYRFPVLHLRALGIAGGIRRQHTLICEQTEDKELVELRGLKEYWSGVYSRERLYQFYAVRAQCAEQEDLLYEAKALYEWLIQMRTNMPAENQDKTVVGSLYLYLADVLMSLHDDAGAEALARKADLISKESNPPASFKLNAGTRLAECQLKLGRAKTALATVDSVRELLSKITGSNEAEDKLILIDFYRVRAKILLQLGRLTDAEKEYQKGIEEAERSLSKLKHLDERTLWVAKTEELYRGLTRIWLEQNKAVKAWKLWEWSKTRAYDMRVSRSFRTPASWDSLEKDILKLREPAGPGVRVTYAVFPDRVHVWTAGHGEVLSLWIAIKEPALEQQIEEFRKLCANASSSLPDLQKQGRELFNLLIQPVMAELSTTESVAFEMDQQLWKLPADALTSPDGRYLAEKYVTRYSPGIEVEEMLRIPKPIQGKNSLLQVEAVPGFGPELSVISGKFKAKVLVGVDATPGQVLSASEQSDILFFFVHAVRSGRGSKLLLNDASMNASDFSSASLHRLALVVLAACSSGSTGAHGLLDIHSLVHAFLAGQVPNVIASQWDVNDDSTVRLMQSAFKNMLAGDSTARALNHAEREFLRLHAEDQHRHPYHWAGFMVVGRENLLTPATSVASR